VPVVVQPAQASGRAQRGLPTDPVENVEPLAAVDQRTLQIEDLRDVRADLPGADVRVPAVAGLEVVAPLRDRADVLVADVDDRDRLTVTRAARETRAVHVEPLRQDR